MRVKLTALYKQLTTKTTLAYISTNRTLNIVVYCYHLANNNYTHTHSLSLSLSLSLCLSLSLSVSLSLCLSLSLWHVCTSPRSSTQIQLLLNDQKKVLSTTSSNWICLLYTPVMSGSLMLSPPLPTPFLQQVQVFHTPTLQLDLMFISNIAVTHCLSHLRYNVTHSFLHSFITMLLVAFLIHFACTAF